MVAEKIETLVVFMEGKKKSADDHGRRDEIPPEAEKGPAWAPGGFNLFYFCLP